MFVSSECLEDEVGVVLDFREKVAAGFDDSPDVVCLLH